MVVAPAEWLPSTMPPQDRMIPLASEALKEAMQDLGSVIGDQSLQILFAVSSTRLPNEDTRNDVVQQILAELRKSGIAARSTIVAEGNAVGVHAIRQAANWLRQGSEAFVALVGVDSHLGQENLASLDDAGRLHSINNSWGFTPGEAAGALVMTTGKILNRTGCRPLARLAAVAAGSESKLLGTETVCIGEGLTQAFRGALADEDKVSHSYCDLNGETYRADEFGFAVCRTRDGFHDAGSFTAAAECWGDVGSASVPLQVALATAAWSRGYAKGSSVLCWSSSATTSLRGALRLNNTWHQFEES